MPYRDTSHDVMQPDNPTWSDRLQRWLAGNEMPAAMRGGPRDRLASAATTAAQLAPGTGQVLSANDLAHAYQARDPKSMAMAILGMLPAGKLGKIAAADRGAAHVPSHLAEGPNFGGPMSVRGEGPVSASGIAEGPAFGGIPSTRGEGYVAPSGMAEGEAMAHQPLNADHNYPVMRPNTPPAVQSAREVLAAPAPEMGPNGALVATGPIHPITSAADREVLRGPRVIGGEGAGPSGTDWYGNFRTNPQGYRLPETMGGPRAALGAGALGLGAYGLANYGQTPPGDALTPRDDVVLGGPDGGGSTSPVAASDRPRVILAPPEARRAAPTPVERAHAIVQRAPDYQSNSRDVLNSPNSVNWGSDESAADFVRADRARQALLRQGQNPTGTNDYAKGGLATGKSVIDPVYHAMMIIRHHLGD